MKNIAASRGFTANALLTNDATRDRVKKEITDAAGALQSGDIFMLTYSGHGGQLPDKNNDEGDGMDETWCLYDGELVDDEIYSLLGKFQRGVRILVFSDSCHSGTVTKVAFYRASGKLKGLNDSVSGVKYRFMPPEVAHRTYIQNKKIYDPILKDTNLAETRDTVKASALLISACQDNQLSADGTFNGLFTSNLLQVWNDGAFEGNYRTFYKAIGRRMSPDQTPNFYRVGELNPTFEKQMPFTV